ncbi:MAG: MFS transporter, partial [Verrucomicrobiota bacterium]
MEEHPNPASEAGGAPEKLSHFRLSLILGALTAFGPLSIDMYLPAFPHIARDLAVPVGAVGFTLAAYLLGTSIGQLIYGPLADRHGRRKPLLAGCVIFGLGSLGCACSTSVAMLTGFRVVQALGGAAGMVIARAVVRDLFHEREAARMFAQLMLVMGI